MNHSMTSTDNGSIVIVDDIKYILPKGHVSVINNKVYLDGELVTKDSGYKIKKVNLFDKIEDWWDDLIDTIEDLFD